MSKALQPGSNRRCPANRHIDKKRLAVIDGGVGRHQGDAGRRVRVCALVNGCADAPYSRIDFAVGRGVALYAYLFQLLLERIARVGREYVFVAEPVQRGGPARWVHEDRKSTRLNSSH